MGKNWGSGNWSRRKFVKTAGVGAMASAFSSGGLLSAQSPSAVGEESKTWNGEVGVLHRSPAPRGVMVDRGDGSVILYSAQVGVPNTPICQAYISSDGGRTWGKPFAPKNAAGGALAQPIQAALKLNSGKIALLTGPQELAPFYFQTSDDGGQSFGEQSTVVPPSPAFLNDVQQRNQFTQLSSGRLILPVYSWVGPAADVKGLINSWRRGSPWDWPGMCYSYVYFSDDEGRTWDRSTGEVPILLGYWTKQHCSFADFEEPTAVELTDGPLLMMGRNRLGCLFQAFSADSGLRWGIAEPTELASSYAPAEIRRIPSTRDLLLCWNQVSKDEIVNGLDRHRLSVAISTDEGKTWGNFKNLYSLDDRNYVRPDPPQIIVPGDQWVKHGLGDVDKRGSVGVENVYVLPLDRSQYYRQPASIRTCYPLICITRKDVIVSYEMGVPGPIVSAMDVFPIDWLYQPIVPKGPYAQLMIDQQTINDADITVEDGTPFGWADVLGKALGDFEPLPKRTRIPLRPFLAKYNVALPANAWHEQEGPKGTFHAYSEKNKVN